MNKQRGEGEEKGKEAWGRQIRIKTEGESKKH